MPDPAAREILDGAMVARIATMSRTGRPHINPLYFYVADGHIHLGTALYTLAAHNVRANPDVTIIFERERSPHDRRLLQMYGTAVVRDEPAVMRRYVRAIARKYIITPGGLWNLLRHPRQWLPMRRHVSAGGACVIDVSPVRVEVVDDLTSQTTPSLAR